MPNWLNLIPSVRQMKDEFFGVSDIVSAQQVGYYLSDHTVYPSGVVKFNTQGCAEAGLC